MTTEKKDNWWTKTGKNVAYCMAVVVPLISIGFAISAAKDEVVNSITKVNVKVDRVSDKVDLQEKRMNNIDAKLDKVTNKVDTVAQRQHDEMLLSKHRFNASIPHYSTGYRVLKRDTPGGRPYSTKVNFQNK